MKSTRTPVIARGITIEVLTLTFGPTGYTPHTVTVPAGTRCAKLDGGSNPWVVDDLSFIEDKKGFLYYDADVYGIRVPEDKVKQS
jgi:hypothetical protein